jgi:hypothetical protein
MASTDGGVLSRIRPPGDTRTTRPIDLDELDNAIAAPMDQPTTVAPASTI